MLTDLGRFIVATPALRNQPLVCVYEWFDVTAFGEAHERTIPGRSCAFPRYMPHVCKTPWEMTQ